MNEKKRFRGVGFSLSNAQIIYGESNEQLKGSNIIDKMNEMDLRIEELEKENKRLKLVVSEVIDAIIDDARVQLNEEFLEYADKFDSIDDLQNEVKKNLYDGDVK